MASIKAIVKPELLVWTRQRAKVTIEDAAKAVLVSIDRLQAWETEGGEDMPTVAQLRALAAKYQFPLAVFYLPGPPSDFAPLRDFRQLTDVEDEAIGPNLAFHIRAAYEHRELALEIFEDLRSQPNFFPLNVTLNDSPRRSARQFAICLASTTKTKSAPRPAHSISGVDALRKRTSSFL